MAKSLLFLVASALVASARAQGLATFKNVDWTGPFYEGESYTFQWTIGNGLPVSASLWSGNYSQPMFTDVPVGLDFVYTIAAVTEGSYTVQLRQGGVQSDVSPLFSIFKTPLNTTASTTNTVAAAATGAATATTYVYFDEHCGCTKTAMTPAATSAPASLNYTVPAMTTPVTQPSPTLTSTYTGAGISIRGGWRPSLIFGAAIVAVFA